MSKGYDYYRLLVLRSSQHQVKQHFPPTNLKVINYSDCAYRVLCKRYNVDVCYSPMIIAEGFSRDMKQNKNNELHKFFTCTEDDKLVLQFAANDPNVLKKAILLARDIEYTKFIKTSKIEKSNIVGVDLNLGCPQKIAKKRNIGAFLMFNQDLVSSIVNFDYNIPLSVKIRIFDDYNLTLKYVRMLKRSGAKLITIHGRTIKQTSRFSKVDYEVIRKIRMNVPDIPIIVNGNINSTKGMNEILKFTSCDGIMSANQLLLNPSTFNQNIGNEIDLCFEYLDIIKKYNPTDASIYIIKNHMYKLLVSVLTSELKFELSKVNSVGDVDNFLKHALYKIKS